MMVHVPSLSSGEILKFRVIPGLPDSFTVFPETEDINLENGKPLKFDVEVRDKAGNLTGGTGHKLNVVCKVSTFYH